MATINFTKENYKELSELVAKAAINQTTIIAKMGQPLNVVDLLHTVSINSLNGIKAALTKKLRDIEDRDEWIQADSSELDTIKEQRKLVNLIVGYKRKKMEIEENRRKREAIKKKYDDLCESTMTPEERKKRYEEELAALDVEEDFK